MPFQVVSFFSLSSLPSLAYICFYICYRIIIPEKWPQEGPSIAEKSLIGSPFLKLKYTPLLSILKYFKIISYPTLEQFPFVYSVVQLNWIILFLVYAVFSPCSRCCHLPNLEYTFFPSYFPYVWTSNISTNRSQMLPPL